MSSVNKAILIGNAGRDTEVRHLASGMAVANVSIATSSYRKDKQTGERLEETQWHRVTFYDKLAEIAGEYVKKGTKIYVEGAIKYGTYTDKDGVERNTTDIIANQMTLLSSRDQQGGGQGGGSSQSEQRQQAPQQRGQPPQQRGQGAAPRQQQQRGGSSFDDMDDDVIPF
jgi:single-strand DNA-binding protein